MTIGYEHINLDNINMQLSIFKISDSPKLLLSKVLYVNQIHHNMFMSQMMKQIIFLCKDNKFETFLSPKVLFVHVEYHNKSSKLSHLFAEVNIVINHCSTSKLLCLKCADLFGCNAQQLLFEKRFPTEDKKCCISSYPQSIAALGSFVKLQQRLLRKQKKVL